MNRRVHVRVQAFADGAVEGGLLERGAVRVRGREREVSSHGSRAMRRVGTKVISFCTVIFVPRSSRPWRWAKMPIVVTMHVPSAVATRSVGEKDSPRPWLSVGASVRSVVAEGPCAAVQRRSPRYWMEISTMIF